MRLGIDRSEIENLLHANIVMFRRDLTKFKLEATALTLVFLGRAKATNDGWLWPELA
jgi:hypothetical protein